MSNVISVLNSGSCPVSQLSATDYFLPDDLLIIERLQQEIDKHISFKLKYEDLKMRLINDICARLSCIRSMAYQDDVYAPLNHSHDYSLVEIFPHCPAKNAAGQDNVLLGTFGLWKYDTTTSAYVKHDIPIYCPAPATTSNNKTSYTVGEVVFTGWKSWPTASTNPKLVSDSSMLSDMNGYWVYPHGQTITCVADEFKEACALYGGGANATSFTVPNLSGFIKLNPGTQKINPMQSISFQNGLSAHTHEFTSTDGNNTQLTTLYLKQYGLGQGSPDENVTNSNCGLHAAGVDITKAYKRNSITYSNYYASGKILNYYIDNISYTVNSGNSSKTADSETEIETYPSHIVLPVILYIGEK